MENGMALLHYKQQICVGHTKKPDHICLSEQTKDKTERVAYLQARTTTVRKTDEV